MRIDIAGVIITASTSPGMRVERRLAAILAAE
jgi:hypothetical protein